MYIHIQLKDDIEEAEAISVARKLIDALDDADAVPPEITEISLGGHPDIWISDEANDAQEVRETPRIETMDDFISWVRSRVRSKQFKEMMKDW